MIECMCDTSSHISLQSLVPFQGDLKKRTEQDIKDLAHSLMTEGLLMPFAVWESDGKCNLLDGHGRLLALQELAKEDEDILNQEFPVLYIQADTEEQARKSLLQITSSYGRITKKGAVKFCAKIPEYKAPSINKFTHPAQKRPKKEQHPGETIMRISVDTNKVQEVLDIFSQVEFIHVL